MSSYRVFLADNHELFRHGIRNTICQSEDIIICGEANSGQDLWKHIEQLCPDLIILDIDLPELNGLKILRKLKKVHHKVKILILTRNKKREFIYQAVTNGADGYILKEEPSGELIRALDVIRHGGKFFSALLSNELMSFIKKKPDGNLLSLRERQVLHCMADGMQNQEIADSLDISIHTVRRHRYNIKKKLSIKHMTDLIKYALVNKHTLAVE